MHRRHQIVDVTGGDRMAESPHDFFGITLRCGEARTRIVQMLARAREDLARVGFGLSHALRYFVEVEIEDVTQQEYGALRRRELFKHNEECSGE